MYGSLSVRVSSGQHWCGFKPGVYDKECEEFTIGTALTRTVQAFYAQA